MATQYLRDREGRTIGKIEDRDAGKIEIRDKFGRLAGSYDPKSNNTRDREGRSVGKGNLLTTLLK